MSRRSQQSRKGRAEFQLELLRTGRYEKGKESLGFNNLNLRSATAGNDNGAGENEIQDRRREKLKLKIHYNNSDSAGLDKIQNGILPSKMSDWRKQAIEEDSEWTSQSRVAQSRKSSALRGAHDGQSSPRRLRVPNIHKQDAYRSASRASSRASSRRSPTHLPLLGKRQVSMEDEGEGLTEEEIKIVMNKINVTAPELPSGVRVKGGSYAQFKASAIKEAQSYGGLNEEDDIKRHEESRMSARAQARMLEQRLEEGKGLRQKLMSGMGMQLECELPDSLLTPELKEIKLQRVQAAEQKEQKEIEAKMKKRGAGADWMATHRRRARERKNRASPQRPGGPVLVTVAGEKRTRRFSRVGGRPKLPAPTPPSDDGPTRRPARPAGTEEEHGHHRRNSYARRNSHARRLSHSASAPPRRRRSSVKRKALVSTDGVENVGEVATTMAGAKEAQTPKSAKRSHTVGVASTMKALHKLKFLARMKKQRAMLAKQEAQQHEPSFTDADLEEKEVEAIVDHYQGRMKGEASRLNQAANHRRTVRMTMKQAAKAVTFGEHEHRPADERVLVSGRMSPESFRELMYDEADLEFDERSAGFVLGSGDSDEKQEFGNAMSRSYGLEEKLKAGSHPELSAEEQVERANLWGVGDHGGSGYESWRGALAVAPGTPHSKVQFFERLKMATAQQWRMPYHVKQAMLPPASRFQAAHNSSQPWTEAKAADKSGTGKDDAVDSKGESEAEATLPSNEAAESPRWLRGELNVEELQKERAHKEWLMMQGMWPKPAAAMKKKPPPKEEDQDEYGGKNREEEQDEGALPELLAIDIHSDNLHPSFPGTSVARVVPSPKVELSHAQPYALKHVTPTASNTLDPCTRYLHRCLYHPSDDNHYVVPEPIVHWLSDPSATRLDLQNYQLSDHLAVAIGEALSVAPGCCPILDVSGNGLSDAGCLAIFQGVTSPLWAAGGHSVLALNLSKNRLTRMSLAPLCALLANDISIDPALARELLPPEVPVPSRFQNTLMALNLSQTRLGDAGTELLAKALGRAIEGEGSSALTRLNLSRCNIGSYGAAALAECLSGVAAITHQKGRALEHPRLGIAGTLAELDLSWNRIGAELGARRGGGALDPTARAAKAAKAAKQGGTDGEAAQEVPTGAVDLILALENCKSLRILDLSWNCLGSVRHQMSSKAAGAAPGADFHKAAAVAAATGVSVVKAAEDGDGEAGMAAMCVPSVAALGDFLESESCEQLIHVSLSHNSFTRADTHVLAQALESNHSIYSLQFDGNGANIDARGYLRCAEGALTGTGIGASVGTPGDWTLSWAPALPPSQTMAMCSPLLGSTSASGVDTTAAMHLHCFLVQNMVCNGLGYNLPLTTTELIDPLAAVAAAASVSTKCQMDDQKPVVTGDDVEELFEEHDEETDDIENQPTRELLNGRRALTLQAAATKVATALQKVHADLIGLEIPTLEQLTAKDGDKGKGKGKDKAKGKKGADDSGNSQADWAALEHIAEDSHASYRRASIATEATRDRNAGAKVLHQPAEVCTEVGTLLAHAKLAQEALKRALAPGYPWGEEDDAANQEASSSKMPTWEPLAPQDEGDADGEKSDEKNEEDEKELSSGVFSPGEWPTLSCFNAEAKDAHGRVLQALRREERQRKRVAGVSEEDLEDEDANAEGAPLDAWWYDEAFDGGVKPAAFCSHAAEYVERSRGERADVHHEALIFGRRRAAHGARALNYALVTNAASVALRFKSCRKMLAGFKYIMAAQKTLFRGGGVRKIVNRCRSPSALGVRDIVLYVEVMIKLGGTVEVPHLCEVRLQLQATANTMKEGTPVATAMAELRHVVLKASKAAVRDAVRPSKQRSLSLGHLLLPAQQLEQAERVAAFVAAALDEQNGARLLERATRCVRARFDAQQSPLAVGMGYELGERRLGALSGHSALPGARAGPDWVCDGWQEVCFQWIEGESGAQTITSLPVRPAVKDKRPMWEKKENEQASTLIPHKAELCLHLSIDGWQPEVMTRTSSHAGEVWYIRRIVPPGRVWFYFTRGGRGRKFVALDQAEQSCGLLAYDPRTGIGNKVSASSDTEGHTEDRSRGDVYHMLAEDDDADTANYLDVGYRQDFSEVQNKSHSTFNAEALTALVDTWQVIPRHPVARPHPFEANMIDILEAEEEQRQVEADIAADVHGAEEHVDGDDGAGAGPRGTSKTLGWQLEDSVFADRRRECASRAFFNSMNAYRQAFAADWRWTKAEWLLPDEDCLREIKSQFRRYYPQVVNLFKHYAARSRGPLQAFFIPLGAWLRLCADAGLVTDEKGKKLELEELADTAPELLQHVAPDNDEEMQAKKEAAEEKRKRLPKKRKGKKGPPEAKAILTIEQCITIFEEVNIPLEDELLKHGVDAGTAESEPEKDAEIVENDINAVERFELVEALLRLAIAKYGDDFQRQLEQGAIEMDKDENPPYKLASIGEAVDEQEPTFIESVAVRHLLQRMLPTVMPWVHDPNAFRVERLYTEQCDLVMRKHKRSLLHIFVEYATIGPRHGRHFMKLRDFIGLFNELHWLDNFFTREQLKHSFVNSQMLSIDEMRTKRFMLLSLVDFLEAIARLLMCCSDKIHPQDDKGDVKRDAVLEPHIKSTTSPAMLEAAANLRSGGGKSKREKEPEKKASEEEDWFGELDRRICRFVTETRRHTHIPELVELLSERSNVSPKVWTQLQIDRHKKSSLTGRHGRKSSIAAHRRRGSVMKRKASISVGGMLEDQPLGLEADALDGKANLIKEVGRDASRAAKGMNEMPMSRKASIGALRKASVENNPGKHRRLSTHLGEKKAPQRRSSGQRGAVVEDK